MRTDQESTTNDRLPEVYKVIGAPGTGKTTRVVGNPDIDEHTSLVQQNLEEYPWEDQFIVTYTKSATDEAATRLAKMLDAYKYEIEERVRTIHSHCYGAINADREQVVGYNDRNGFCKKHDLEFSYESDEDDMMGQELAEGNQLFKLYGWLKSNRMEIEDWEDCPIDWSGSDDPAQLMREWDVFKHRHDVLEFHDMIEKTVEQARSQIEEYGLGILFPSDDITHEEMFKAALNDPNRDKRIMDQMRGEGSFIDAKILYVDEVQDLTPLQWAWYLAQKVVAEQVYIGGDDDQTVYGWAGATPDFMLEEEGEFEVLDRTYRIPSNVWEKCDETIKHVDRRQSKSVEPDREGGEFVALKKPTVSDLRPYLLDDDVYMVFRARYMIDEFTDKLHGAGIPYRNESTFDIWSEDIELIRNGIYKLETGDGRLKGREVSALKEYATHDMLNDNIGFSNEDRVMGNVTGLDPEKVKAMFATRTVRGIEDFDGDWYVEASDDLNYYEGEAIMGSVENGTTDLNPDTLRIGTIHSAKGREADTVILATDTTQTIAEEMSKELTGRPDKHITDAERRVYYVGMTRAADTLVMAEGVENRDQYIECEALFGETPDYENVQSRSEQYKQYQ